MEPQNTGLLEEENHLNQTIISFRFELLIFRGVTTKTLIKVLGAPMFQGSATGFKPSTKKTSAQRAKWNLDWIPKNLTSVETLSNLKHLCTLHPSECFDSSKGIANHHDHAGMSFARVVPVHIQMITVHVRTANKALVCCNTLLIIVPSRCRVWVHYMLSLVDQYSSPCAWCHHIESWLLSKDPCTVYDIQRQIWLHYIIS